MNTRQAHTLHRTGDPDTSRQAAHSLDTTSMRAALLAVFASHPRGLTSEEASIAAGYGAGAGPWKRVSDLEYEQLIERAKTPDGKDKVRTAASGRTQLVRVITCAGRAEHAYLAMAG